MTRQLANMPSSLADVSVAFLDQSKLKHSKTVIDKDGIIKSTYVLDDGALDVSTSVVLTQRADKASGQMRQSISLSSVQIELDADSIEIRRDPIEVVVAWNTPLVGYSVASVMTMIGTAYALCFNGVTSKVPNTGILTAVARVLPDKLYS